MSYTRGPYFHRAALPSPPRPRLHSARKIDFATSRYVLDEETGGNEGMNGTAQRVVLAVAIADRDAPPGVIDDSFIAGREDAVRRELQPLTAARPPHIIVDRVEAEATFPGAVESVVDYQNTNEQPDESVQLT